MYQITLSYVKLKINQEYFIKSQVIT